jgi:alpha-tubulin suppressor-like RCC1 family protein
MDNNSHIPVQVKGGDGAGFIGNITAVAAGTNFSLALKDDGTVWAWGYNSSGQLGDGTTVSRSVPVQVAGLDKVTAISAGAGYSLAIKKDGSVVGWGYNGDGELGIGTTVDSLSPVPVSGLTGVTAVCAAYQHSLALKSDGTVWAWGGNDNGELGNASTTSSTTPVQVNGLIGMIAIASGADSSHCMALKSDGTVWAWGTNIDGELGTGTTFKNSAVPVQVKDRTGSSNLTKIKGIATGNSFSLAIASDGTVWGWGYNTSGQLGDGTTDRRTLPVQVQGLKNVIAVTADASFSVALVSKPN